MIKATDKRLAEALRAKIDNLNKPKGSLGKLEDLAMQIGLIQQTLSPTLTHPCHLLFGGDHGIEREGVSASPREVTWQQMVNYTRGGGAVNMFCRQHGFELHIVDVGVDYPSLPQTITNRKIAYGTKNFRYEPAMTMEEYKKALAAGEEQVEICKEKGCNVLSIGEMGIGNTSPSSLLMHYFLDIPLKTCVGAGSGLSNAGIKHKYEVLKASAERFDCSGEDHSAENIIRNFAGFEMVAAIGAMLKAAELNMIVLVDGFIMTACMLAAEQLDKNVRDYAVFGHVGDEGGHKLMLEKMEASALLHLGMRLGEGTGAICAYPLLESAVRMINEMDNFEHAEITKYF